MPTRVYVGDDEQYFPDFGRWLSPGDEVEYDGDDPRFVTPAQAKKHAKPDVEEQ